MTTQAGPERDVMIDLRGVKKSFADEELLKDISFTIRRGERVSLLGAGGSGKSTILKIILGLEDPTAGSVFLLGKNIHEIDEIERQNLLKSVGMAFQQGALFDYLSVKDNLMFAADNMTQFSSEKKNKLIESLLKRVKLPQSGPRFPFELSGGMQRRVGIARALVTEPVLALFDEPTAGLDPVTSTIILNMIHELVDQETTASLVVTSNVEVAIRFSSRTIVIQDGRVVADGPWQDLLLDGPAWVRNFLSVRLIGLDFEYAQNLKLPKKFLDKHWLGSARN